MILADMFEDLNSADATGSTLTAAIMNNGLHTGGTGTWVIQGNPFGTSYTIAAHRMQRFNAVVVPGFACGSNSVTRAMAYNHTTLSQATVEFDMPAGNPPDYPLVTAFGMITFGPPNDGSGGVYDLVAFNSGALGHTCSLQLVQASAPTRLIVHLETSPGGVTTHGPEMNVVAGKPYWFNLRADMGWRPGGTLGTTTAPNGIGEVALFHPFTGQCLGYSLAPTVKVGTDAMDIPSAIRVGNGEIGTSASTTYFEHFGLDYRYGRFPIFPLPVESTLETQLGRSFNPYRELPTDVKGIWGIIQAAGRGLFLNDQMAGMGTGGSFFRNPLA